MSTITVLDGNGDPQTIAAVAATGQAPEADCLPVVLPAAQVATLATETTLASVVTALGSPMQAGGSVSVSGSVAVTGTFWQATQPVSIASWGGLTDAQLRAAAVPVSLASVPTHAVTQSGAWSVSVSGSVAVTGTFWQATQPVSAASLPLPSGAATEATLSAASAKLPATLGPKAGAASLSVVEATPTTVTIVSVTTAATGANFTAFASQACESLDLVNTAPAAVDIEVRRGGSGNTIVVPAGSSRMFVGLSNASGLQVRRVDQSNTQITITGEAIAQ